MVRFRIYSEAKMDRISNGLDSNLLAQIKNTFTQGHSTTK